MSKLFVFRANLRHACIGATLVAAVCSSPASAQELVPEKTISVRARARPAYDAIGIRWGAFRLYPELTVGSAHDDNIYASAVDLVDDRITTLGANVNLRSDGRVPMSVHAGGDTRSYSDNQLEDYDNWESGASVGYTFARNTVVTLTGDYALGHESRGDPTFPSSAIERPSFKSGKALLALTQQLASGALDLSVATESLNFDDAVLADGVLFDQDFRDRNTQIFQAQGDVAVGSSTALFVRAVRTHRDYKLDADSVGVNRDSSSNALLGGATFEISNLMRGEVGIGVLDLDNEDSAQGDTRSVAVNSNIDVYLTQLITATVDVQRASEAADIVGSASYIGSTYSLSLDYEIRRNLILSARFIHSRREYTGLEDADRNELSGIGAEWLLNRRFSVGFDYALVDYSWSAAEAARDYTEKTFAAQVSFAL